MRLVTIDVPPTARTGVLNGDDVLDFALIGNVIPLAAWIPADMPTLLAAGDEGLDVTMPVRAPRGPAPLRSTARR